MIEVFHGTNKKAHNGFQAWRSKNVDGYNLTEKTLGHFIIHYAQDKRENDDGRGCNHQGGSGIKYGMFDGSCMTTARKVCSNSFHELMSWVRSNGFTAKSCKHCDTKRFPFPNFLIEETADETPVDEREYLEGSPQDVVSTRFERDRRAREACLTHYGTACFICEFDFASVYGSKMKGLIHVHHLKPISSVGAEHSVNPIHDMRPVCPNCHSVIHRREPPYTIEEMLQFISPAVPTARADKVKRRR